MLQAAGQWLRENLTMNQQDYSSGLSLLKSNNKQRHSAMQQQQQQQQKNSNEDKSGRKKAPQLSKIFIKKLREKSLSLQRGGSFKDEDNNIEDNDARTLSANSFKKSPIFDTPNRNPMPIEVSQEENFDNLSRIRKGSNEDENYEKNE